MSQNTTQIISTILERKHTKTVTHVLSLFIFRGHSTREPASLVCNDEQGDLFYSAGPHRNRYQPELTQEKLGRGFGKKCR